MCVCMCVVGEWVLACRGGGGGGGEPAADVLAYMWSQAITGLG